MHGVPEAVPAEVREDYLGTESSILWGKGKRNGLIQPGEEITEIGPHQCRSVPEKGLRGWSQTLLSGCQAIGQKAAGRN